MKVRIILASGSPRRRELLSQMGLRFELRPGSWDEVSEETDPGRHVEELSYYKALEAAGGSRGEKRAPFLPLTGLSVQENELILAADTMVFYQGKALGKPADDEEASSMLHLLSGQTHQVYTGVTLAFVSSHRLRMETFSKSTDVELYPLGEDEIAAYLATGDHRDKAGAYGIQGIFAKHVKAVRGDYSNVVGLPVGELYRKMKELGLWEDC